MTSKEFVIWLKGFTEACNDFTATPKQWDRIKEVLNEVQDYDDHPGLDEEINDWYLPTGTTFGSHSSGSGVTSVTNLPNHTNITYTTKQQLND